MGQDQQDLLDNTAFGRKAPCRRRNAPVAGIRPIPLRPKVKRPIGLAEGIIEVPPAFFDPLPDDLINSSAHSESRLTSLTFFNLFRDADWEHPVSSPPALPVHLTTAAGHETGSGTI